MSKLMLKERDFHSTVGDIVKGIAVGKVDFSLCINGANIQRGQVWKKDKYRSELIKTILEEGFIPPVVLVTMKKGTYSTVDGQQRLRTIKAFTDNEFKLKLDRKVEIPGFKEVNLDGKYFKDLPKNIQKIFLDCSIKMCEIPYKDDTYVKTTFANLNKGMELTNMEKNRVYLGTVLNYLNDVITHPLFEKGFIKGIKKERFVYQELAMKLLLLEMAEQSKDPQYDLSKKAIEAYVMSREDLEDSTPNIRIRTALTNKLDFLYEVLNRPEYIKLRGKARFFNTVHVISFYLLMKDVEHMGLNADWIYEWVDKFIIEPKKKDTVGSLYIQKSSQESTTSKAGITKKYLLLKNELLNEVKKQNTKKAI